MASRYGKLPSELLERSTSQTRVDIEVYNTAVEYQAAVEGTASEHVPHSDAQEAVEEHWQALAGQERAQGGTGS